MFLFTYCYYWNSINNVFLYDVPKWPCFILQEKLVAILFGMLRLQKFQFIDVYREETFTGMKAIVKQVRELTMPLPRTVKQSFYLTHLFTLFLIGCESSICFFHLTFKVQCTIYYQFKLYFLKVNILRHMHSRINMCLIFNMAF